MRSSRERGDPRKFRSYGLVLWLRAGYWTIGTGISQYTDQSGSDNHVTQVTGSAQPTVGTSTTGRPVAVFVKANSSALFKANVNLFADGPYTVIFAVKFDDTASGDVAISMADGSAGIHLKVQGTSRDIGHIGLEDHADGDRQTSSYELWTARRAADSAPSLRLNGVDEAVTTATTGLLDPGADGILALGAWNGVANFLDGRIGDVVAFTSELPADIASRVEKHIGTF